ncbi:24-hydroxycholesterol 7-alpha-hydroxylase [Trichoplax sp. H2]|nr:24-hydroxycholesterol 7-alpha-hydroxylase [Trichoplax sp. H2]|eukprot:RDD42293.1 24-hydroxycholesterol 7-alpha-hydroxylase [Trichoplax sp. H2]
MEQHDMVLLIALAFFTLLFLYFMPRKKNRQPPVIGGYIPLIGCAIQFGRDPIQFIRQCRDKYGKIFTLSLPGQRLTFLLDANDYDKYYSTNCVDFQAAVQPTCQKTANITKSAFIDSHSKLHDLVKGRLSSNYLQVLSIKLSQKFHQQSKKLPQDVEMELMDIVKTFMFKPVLECMFGDDILFSKKVVNILPIALPWLRSLVIAFSLLFELLTKSGDPSDCEDLWQQLKDFDADFEMGAQIPEVFLSKWAKSKLWLLRKFEHAVQQAKDVNSDQDNNSKTIFQSLLSTVRKDAAANFGLLFFWATQANAIPAVYWSLINICQNPRIYEKVMENLLSVWSIADDEVMIKEEDIKHLSYIKWCILEAIRLESPGVSSPRMVTKPIEFQNFVVPPGNMMVISPFWSHRDKDYFTDPDTYNPDRWLKMNNTKKAFIDGFVAFGGGRYQCPGRWFAIMEMQVFISLLLLNYKIELIDCKPQKPTRLVGLQHPHTACIAKLSRRNSCR